MGALRVRGADVAAAARTGGKQGGRQRAVSCWGRHPVWGAAHGCCCHGHNHRHGRAGRGLLRCPSMLVARRTAMHAVQDSNNMTVVTEGDFGVVDGVVDGTGSWDTSLPPLGNPITVVGAGLPPLTVSGEAMGNPMV